MREQEVLVALEDRETETVEQSLGGERVQVESEALIQREVFEAQSVDEERETLVITQEAEREHVSSGSQGPRGATGPIGPSGGSAFQRISAEPISAVRVVWEDDQGYVRVLDYRDVQHIDFLLGITITAASGHAQPIIVQRSGVIDADGLGLTPGRVWLGVDGALTQIPPEDGHDVLIGSAVSGGRLILNLQDNITLE